jgi:hypothetical protein
MGYNPVFAAASFSSMAQAPAPYQAKLETTSSTTTTFFYYHHFQFPPTGSYFLSQATMASGFDIGSSISLQMCDIFCLCF